MKLISSIVSLLFVVMVTKVFHRTILTVILGLVSTAKYSEMDVSSEVTKLNPLLLVKRVVLIGKKTTNSKLQKRSWRQYPSYALCQNPRLCSLSVALSFCTESAN